jgi:hypothetical protein
MVKHLRAKNFIEEDKVSHRTLCGGAYTKQFLTEDVCAWNLCTKCSSKWFAQQNTEPFRLGERIIPPNGLYRSVYPILDDQAELFGYVVIEHGWSKRWFIQRIDVNRPNNMGSVAQHSFTSREAALVGAIALVRDQKLHSLSQANAIQAEQQQHLKQVSAQNEANRLARIERHARIQTALCELLAKPDLSNTQRVALHDAAVMLRLHLVSSETNEAG